MKRILGIAVVLGLVGALTVVAQEVKPGKVDVVDFGEGVKLEMVLVPAGKFKMGFTKKELADFKVDFQEDIKKITKKELGKETLDVVDLIMSKQGKQHEVTLTKPFYMGKYEVTQEQYEAVMGNNPSSKTKGAKLPVTDVSWEDCQEFIKKLNASTKGGYRLPYEAEFEYACRAGTTTAYSYGDSLTKSDANIKGESIKEVGSYKPNAFGLYDLHGNVWEWCEDRYGDYPKGAVTDPKGPATGEDLFFILTWIAGLKVTDPKGPATGEDRVLRGGSFTDIGSGARSSHRFFNSPTYRFFSNGFRLARTK